MLNPLSIKKVIISNNGLICIKERPINLNDNLLCLRKNKNEAYLSLYGRIKRIKEINKEALESESDKNFSKKIDLITEIYGNKLPMINTKDTEKFKETQKKRALEKTKEYELGDILVVSGEFYLNNNEFKSDLEKQTNYYLSPLSIKEISDILNKIKENDEVYNKLKGVKNTIIEFYYPRLYIINQLEKKENIIKKLNEFKNS